MTVRQEDFTRWSGSAITECWIYAEDPDQQMLLPSLGASQWLREFAGPGVRFRSPDGVKRGCAGGNTILCCFQAGGVGSNCARPPSLA